MVSFETQKFLIFIKSSSSVFYLVACTFWCHILETIAKSKVTETYSYVFFMTFIRLALPFRSLIPFEKVYTYSVRSG